MTPLTGRILDEVLRWTYALSAGRPHHGSSVFVVMLMLTFGVAALLYWGGVRALRSSKAGRVMDESPRGAGTMFS